MNLFSDRSSIGSHHYNSLWRMFFLLLLLGATPVFIWAVMTQRIELRKRAATSEAVVCWNKVGEMISVGSSSPTYVWNNDCKGDPTRQNCNNIVSNLTATEIYGYTNWKNAGKPYISGCGMVSSIINWVTPHVRFRAQSLKIKVNGKVFHGIPDQNTPVSVHSNPGTPDYTTLEVEWTENSTPMRLFISYYAETVYMSNPPRRIWGMKDIRTYDGNTPGNWISFTENRHTQDGVIGTESPINGSFLFQNGQNEFYVSGVQQLPFPGQTTPSPTPRYPYYIGLDTQYAFVRADALTITANGKTFNTLNGGSTLKVTSNPGSGNNLTWEATWFENGIEMRLYIYFDRVFDSSISNQPLYHITSIRTYDGKSPGNWIYYNNLGFWSSPVSTSSYYENTGLTTLKGTGSTGDVGQISINHYQVGALFKTGTTTITPTPTCIPRPACMDPLPGQPQCMMKMVEGSWFCPKNPTPTPTCTPRPACMDPLPGQPVCSMKIGPGTWFCPKTTPTPTCIPRPRCLRGDEFPDCKYAGVSAPLPPGGYYCPAPSTVCKTGVNSFSVGLACPNNNNTFESAKYTCYDGFAGIVGGNNTCQTSLALANLAQQACVGRSSCTVPTPSCIPLPECVYNPPIVDGRPVRCSIPPPPQGRQYCPQPTATPIVTGKPGDFNGDGKVNILDYNVVLNNFGKLGPVGFSPADLNADGKVNLLDYNMLLNYFGK